MAKNNTAIQDILVEIRKKKRDLVNLSKTVISVGWVDGSKAHQKALSSLKPSTLFSKKYNILSPTADIPIS